MTACAVATSCCISDEPCQWEKATFDPTQLRHLLISICFIIHKCNSRYRSFGDSWLSCYYNLFL